MVRIPQELEENRQEMVKIQLELEREQTRNSRDPIRADKVLRRKGMIQLEQ